MQSVYRPEISQNHNSIPSTTRTILTWARKFMIIMVYMIHMSMWKMSAIIGSSKFVHVLAVILQSHSKCSAGDTLQGSLPNINKQGRISLRIFLSSGDNGVIHLQRLNDSSLQLRGPLYAMVPFIMNPQQNGLCVSASLGELFVKKNNNDRIHASKSMNSRMTEHKQSTLRNKSKSLRKRGNHTQSTLWRDQNFN